MSQQFIEIPHRINFVEDINCIFRFMIDCGASDLFIHGNDHIKISVHGKIVRLTSRRLTENEVDSIIRDIYGANASALLGSATPIDTAIIIALSDNEKYRFRLNGVNTQKNDRTSVRLTFRAIPSKLPTVQDLNVDQEIIDACVSAGSGLVWVSGATGMGKSTLIASILRHRLERPDSNENLVTVEEPIEFTYDEVITDTSSVSQLEVGRHVQSFSHAVKNAMRMAPKTIYIAESRDAITMDATLEAAVSGHVVFTTVHANSVANNFRRAVSVYRNEERDQAYSRAVASTRMIIHQILVPSEDGKRLALREFLTLNDSMRDELETTDNDTVVLRQLVAKHGRPMIRSAEEARALGVISCETLNWVHKNYGG